MTADTLEQPTPAPRIRGGIGADGPYWDALERGEFKVSRCGDCHRWMWPAHFRCGQCGSWEIAWEDVDPRGTIYTWTRNHAVSDVLKERRADVPYITLLVELPQAAGARVAGVLQGNESNLRIGAPVRGVVRPPESRAKGYATIAWEITTDEDAR